MQIFGLVLHFLCS